MDYALGPIVTPLEELRKLPDWSGRYLVTDTINFD
jgi:hypothetical protein